MSKIEGAAVYGPANEIRVVMFKGDTIHRMACQNAIPEPWSEALDLSFDVFSQVSNGSAGSMAVSPGNMLAGRGARWIT